MSTPVKDLMISEHERYASKEPFIRRSARTKMSRLLLTSGFNAKLTTTKKSKFVDDFSKFQTLSKSCTRHK